MTNSLCDVRYAVPHPERSRSILARAALEISLFTEFLKNVNNHRAHIRGANQPTRCFIDVYEDVLDNFLYDSVQKSFENFSELGNRFFYWSVEIIHARSNARL